MKISKNKKYLPEQTQHTTNSLLISSDLSIPSLYEILTKNPPMINKVDRNSETFLSYAFKRKNLEVCEFLLTSPIIDLTFRDKKLNTYLHLAICTLNSDLVTTLIKKGSDINAKNINGDTPLHIAYMLNTSDIQDILIENGADDTITNNNGFTPLIMNNNNCESILHIEENSICSVHNENISNHNREISFNNEINNTNQSIKIEWSDANVKSHLRKLNLSNENSTSIHNQVYAKSFVETPHIKKHAHNTNGGGVVYNNASGDTRYNSSTNKSFNKEEDDDLFDITGSIESYRKVNSDKIGMQVSLNGNDNIFNLSKSINDNTNPIEEEYDDYVNTRVMNSQGIKLSQSNEGRYNISISGSFMKSKDNSKHIVIKEEPEETGNNAISEDKPSFQEIGKGYMEIEDPFTFSSPHIDEINKNEEHKLIQDKQNEESQYEKDKLKSRNCINTNNTNDRTLQFVEPKQIIYENENDKKTSQITNEDNNNNDHLEIFEFPQTTNNINTNNDTNPPLPASSSTISTSIESTKTTTNPHFNNPLYTFLSDIHMEKHFNTLLSAGYDDIQLLIEQTSKTNAIIKDDNLKSIGLSLPGERAKILIYLQEKAKLFPFVVPKKVYYLSSSPNEPNQDHSLKKMENWLSGLKLQDYLMKFINNGYHSLDLLMLQMQSKCPLTEEILENELGIDKPGYRARIINSLQYEGRNYYKKNKLGVLAIDAKQNSRTCDCVLF